MSMNKSEMKRNYNKHRFDVMVGHGTLYIIDHQKKTMVVYDKREEVSEYRENYVEDALETNGWKHLRDIEDNLN